jgi:hypothetical protein
VALYTVRVHILKNVKLFTIFCAFLMLCYSVKLFLIYARLGLPINKEYDFILFPEGVLLPGSIVQGIFAALDS